MEKHRRFSSVLPPTQNGATATEVKKARKLSYAYEYNVVPRSIVNMKEEELRNEEEEEDPQKRRRRLGIPFEEDFAKKKSKG